MVDWIRGKEGDAQRSLMHRYNAAAEMVEGAARAGSAHERRAALVKPREIAVAQVRPYRAVSSPRPCFLTVQNVQRVAAACCAQQLTPWFESIALFILPVMDGWMYCTGMD